MARKFLYFVAVLIVLVIGAAVALRHVVARTDARSAFVPSAEFDAQHRACRQRLSRPGDVVLAARA